MFSSSEPNFHLYGFVMCIMAMVARALKSIVQGILLSSKGEKFNSMNLFLYMAFIHVMVLFTTTMLLEPNLLHIIVV
jgi:hypothetical protein